MAHRSGNPYQSDERVRRVEVRAVRDEHAARCGYDVDEIFRDIRASQEAFGREYVRLPARRPVVVATNPNVTKRVSPN